MLLEVGCNVWLGLGIVFFEQVLNSVGFLGLCCSAHRGGFALFSERRKFACHLL